MAGLCLLLAGCAASPAPDAQLEAVTRSLGQWSGRGSQTIGIISESGRLRVHWQTTRVSPDRAGTFRLALHSAVSGRPIELIADHRGDGAGTAEVADDPRPYNFMVDATDLEWSFSVEEIVAGAPVTRAPPESSR